VWYGGEPLLYKDLVGSISNNLIELSHRYNLPYKASIITNGFLINDDIIKMLDKHKIRFAQITIDGKKEHHDNRRLLANNDHGGTFDTILANVSDLALAKIKVGIRMNVDEDNYEGIESFLDEISQKINIKDNVSVYLGHIFNQKDNDIFNSCITKKQFALCKLNLLMLLQKYGFKKSNNSLPKTRLNYCSAMLKNTFVIDPAGRLYKCWNDICEPKYSIGNVFDYLSKNKNTEYKSLRWQSHNVFNNIQCSQCKLLPICAGGCPREQINFSSSPKCEDFKFNIEDIIKFNYLF
jgi:uncharacterized protein